MDQDLVAERTRLEQQIGELESSLLTETARLELARDAGVRPRGLAVGAIIGVLATAAFVVACFISLMTTIGRLD